MKKYVCEPCGYEYDPAVGDPDNGIAPGTAFEDLPDDWVCPICGLGNGVSSVFYLTKRLFSGRYITLLANDLP